MLIQTPEDPTAHLPLSPTDFHLLLVLSRGNSYGYALMKAMQEQSGGVIRPEIGSLYRILARLVSSGLAAAAGDRVPESDGPGRPRRYYRITSLGHTVVEAETDRLRALIGQASTGALADSRGEA